MASPWDGLLPVLSWVSAHHPSKHHACKLYDCDWISSSWFRHKRFAQWEELNTLRPRQNDRHFADDSFKSIFLNENFRLWNKISLKFVPNGPINNIPALVEIMAWRRPGDKPLSEPMLARWLTHICVTRPHLVNPMLLQISGYNLKSF